MEITYTDNIKYLAPTMVCRETPEENLAVSQAYEKRLTAFRPLMGAAKRYFPGGLHDSRVVICKKDHKNLIFKLNDIGAADFAYILAEKKKLTLPRETAFFLTIVFEEIRHLSYNTIDEYGKIHKTRFIKPDEYLYEEIVEWKNGDIQIVFELWNCGSSYLLSVACKSARIIEEQYKGWQECFGTECDRYFDAFMKARETRSLVNLEAGQLIDRLD